MLKTNCVVALISLQFERRVLLLAWLAPQVGAGGDGGWRQKMAEYDGSRKKFVKEFASGKQRHMRTEINKSWGQWSTAAFWFDGSRPVIQHLSAHSAMFATQMPTMRPVRMTIFKL